MKTLSVFSSFAVNDLKPAKEFYGKKLGLSVKENKQMGLLEIKIAGETISWLTPRLITNRLVLLC